MKKSFKISPKELQSLLELYDQKFESQDELDAKVNQIWIELGQKYGFDYRTVEQQETGFPAPETGLHWLAEPLKSKDFAEAPVVSGPETPTIEQPMDNQRTVEVQQGTDPKKKLIVFLDTNPGLAPADREQITKSFGPFFDQAAQWLTIAKTLKVTDITQVAEMKKAKDARLALKRIRTSVEGVRKQLKQEVIVRGNAIDGIANLLKSAIEPIEDHLEKQEKFAEIQEMERLKQLGNDRLIELQQYDYKLAPGIDLGAMDDEMYNIVREGVVKAWEDQQERIQQEEENRREQQRLTELGDSRLASLGDLKFYLPAGTGPMDLSVMPDDDFEFLRTDLQSKKDYADNALKESQEKAKVQALAESRRRTIIALGVLTDGSLLYYRDRTIPIKSVVSELINLPEDEWNQRYPEVETIILDFKRDVDKDIEEKAQAQQLRNSRLITIQAIGFVKFEADWVYKDAKGYNFLIIRNSMIDSLSNEQFSQLIDEYKQKIEAKRIEENPPAPKQEAANVPASSAPVDEDQAFISLVKNLNVLLERFRLLKVSKKRKTLAKEVEEKLQELIDKIDSSMV